MQTVVWYMIAGYSKIPVSADPVEILWEQCKDPINIFHGCRVVVTLINDLKQTAFPLIQVPDRKAPDSSNKLLLFIPHINLTIFISEAILPY